MQNYTEQIYTIWKIWNINIEKILFVKIWICMNV